PSALAVADDTRFAVGIRMQGNHFVEEQCFGAGNILDGLPRHGFGQKSDEVTGVTGLEDDPDLTVRLEPADPGTVPRTRVDDHEGAPPRINGDAFRRHDPHEPVIHRAPQRSPIDDELRLVTEHMRHSFGQMLAILVGALAHDVPEQHRALGGIDHVVHRWAEQAEGVRRVLWLGRGHLLCTRFKSPIACKDGKASFCMPCPRGCSLVYPCRDGVGANGALRCGTGPLPRTCEALRSMPAQGHADVTRQTVREIHDLYFQLVAPWPKMLLPEFIHFLRLAGECLFPAYLLLIDGAALVRAQLVGKAKDLALG